MEPERTCLGCRSRATRSSLLRLVVQGDEIIVDLSATLPGRGAWVHPTTECVDTAIQRKAFGRALRRLDVALDRGVIRAVVETAALSIRPSGSAGSYSGQAERPRENRPVQVRTVTN